MPSLQQVTVSAQIPDYGDLAAKYPRHVNKAQGSLNSVWNSIMTPQTCLIARAFATLGFPPVTAVADAIARLHQSGAVTESWDVTKQFSGVFIAVLMESNGLTKTGLRRGVPHTDWNVGTCFS